MTTTKNNEHNKLNFSSEREQSQACLNSAEHEKNQGRKVLNVPNLRFPEFKGEWKKTTIGEIATIKNGPFGSVLHAEDYVDEGMPIVTTEHFKSGNLPLSKNGIPQVSEDDYCRLKGYMLETDDIVFSRVGSVDINAHVEYVQQGWLFSGRVLRVRPIKSVNSLCLHYVLSTESVKRDIRNRAVGQTMPSINTPILSNTGIYMSQSEAEQKKIANLLSLIDERISTQNKIIEDLKMLKSAIIEIEYTPNTKTTSHIGNVIEQISKRNKNNAIQNVLSVSNRQGFIKQSDQFENRNVASEDISNYKIVEKNDFSFNPARINVGSIARLTTFEKGIVSPMYICFRTQENVAPEYIEFFFESKHFYCEIQKRLEGSVRQCLSFEGLCNIPFYLPSLEMQQRIGKRLFTLGQKIKTETDLLELLNEQKQYLLRQMFI